MKVTVFDSSTGQITRNVTIPVGSANLQTRAGEDWIEGEYQDDQFYVENFTAVAMPPRPSEHHQFDYDTKQWLDPRTLDDLKAAKAAAITAARVQQDQRFPFDGKWFQADAAAWKQISGVHGWVAAQNSLPPGWPGQWKAEDNTYTAIPDVATWWQFYGAVVARGSDNFSHSEALKAQVAAATTAAEVEAVPVW